MITEVDPDLQTVFVGATHERVEAAPEYKELDQASAERLASYHA